MFFNADIMILKYTVSNLLHKYAYQIFHVLIFWNKAHVQKYTATMTNRTVHRTKHNQTGFNTINRSCQNNLQQSRGATKLVLAATHCSS